MPFWLHFILGYLLSVFVATLVTLSVPIAAVSLDIILGIKHDVHNFIIVPFLFGYFTTLIAAFPGFSVAVYFAGKSEDKPRLYWIFAGLANSGLAVILFYMFTGGLFAVVMIPFALVGGASAGYVYYLFRKRFSSR